MRSDAALSVIGGPVPTYQYSCTECGEPLEVVQAFTDDALTECPSCGGRLRKRYNAVGIVFKGSGFYRTDSRTGSSASEPAAADSGKSGNSSKSENAGKSGESGKSGKSDTAASGAAPKGESSGSTAKKSEPAKSASSSAA